MEDDEAHELYVTESESSATIDSDTTIPNRTMMTREMMTRKMMTQNDDMQDDDQGATRMDMCYLLSQLRT
jgi:hypothetical protein